MPTTMASLYASRLKEKVAHVLHMAQRDVQESYSAATYELEEDDAIRAADSLNATWYLLESAPALYFHLKGVLPLAEQALRINPSANDIKMLQLARQSLKRAERIIPLICASRIPGQSRLKR